MTVVWYECLRCGRRWSHVEADECPCCFPVARRPQNAREQDPVRQEPGGQLVIA